jgi:hypothetical protein
MSAADWGEIAYGIQVFLILAGIALLLHGFPRLWRKS